MAVVTVLFSPSLCIKRVSCVRSVVDDETVQSFLAGLHRDFQLLGCIADLELYLVPASRLWTGIAFLSRPDIPSGGAQRLSGEDGLVSKNCGSVIFLVTRAKDLQDEVPDGRIVGDSGRAEEEGRGICGGSEGELEMVEDRAEENDDSVKEVGPDSNAELESMSFPHTGPGPAAVSSVGVTHTIADGSFRDVSKSGKWEVKEREWEEGSDEGIVMEEVESDSNSVIVVESDGEAGQCGGNPPCVSMEQKPVVRCCGMELSHDDLYTLQPPQWLNDQVVNCYMKLLMEEEGVRTAYIASTFFYTKLSRSGSKGVRRWMKSVDFSKLKLFLVPVHLRMHWCLVAVQLRNRTIEYYDSLGGYNPLCVKRILRFVLHRLGQHSRSAVYGSPRGMGQHSRSAVYGSPRGMGQHSRSAVYRSTHWRKGYPKDIPKQLNSSDCGVFMCQFARWLYRSRDYARPHSSIPFTQTHMHRTRHLMIQELRNRKLMRLDFE